MSRDFNGSNGYLDLGNPTSIDPILNMTVFAWINPDSVTGTHIVLTRATDASNTGFRWGTFGVSLRFTKAAVADYTSSLGFSLTTGSWFAMAAVVSGSGVKHSLMKTDGTQSTSTNSTTNAFSGTPADAQIGQSPFIGGGFFDGKIAQVVVYIGNQLSDAELKALAYGGVWSVGHIFDGYWPVWGVASPDPDLSGNGFNGTLSGTGPAAAHAPCSTYAPPYVG